MADVVYRLVPLCSFHIVCMSCFHCEKRDATHPDGTATAQNASRSYLQNAMSLVFNIKLILFPSAFVLNHQSGAQRRNDPRLKTVMFSNDRDDGCQPFFPHTVSVVPV